MRPVLRAGWFGRAFDVLEDLTRRQRFITIDDLREALGDDQPPAPQDYGLIFQAAHLQERLIRPTRRSVKARHKNARGRRVELWCSTAWDGFSDHDKDLESHLIKSEGGEQVSLL